MQWYDAEAHRLVYEGKRATDTFWASHWQTAHNLPELLVSNRTDPLIQRLTQRYLPVQPTTRVLDGGCGIGQHVARLSRLGYDAYGIDYAASTVARVKHAAPHLNISVGDVRRLPFADQFFDGYWSIGVIEHWFEGYDAAAQEMARVIKPGGYLFLTFPHMSRLRRFKAQRGAYPALPKDFSASDFYQFALEGNAVIGYFTALGFQLVERGATDGLKGLKDEVQRLRPLLQALYDSPRISAKATKVVVSSLLTPLTGHSAVLVLQRRAG